MDQASTPYLLGNMDKIRDQLFPETPEMAGEKYDKELAQFNLNQQYIRVFSTADGNAVFLDLWARYVTVPQFDPGIENAAQHGFFKEGCKYAVLEIQRRMLKAQEGPPAQPVPNEDFLE